MEKLFVNLTLWILKRAKSEDVRNRILTEVVCHLFNTVSAEDILKENPDGTLRFEDKQLPAHYKQNLREQAELLPNLLLWKVIQKDIQYQINKKLFLEANITTDMLWGKMILWMNDVINTRINSLRK